MKRLRVAGAVIALMVAGGAVSPLGAQTGGGRIVPTNQVLVTGYGTVGYAYRTQADNINAFTATLNPVLLFQFQDRVLFEAELEFELEEGVTETGLEYAQLDFIASDNLVLVGGKFLIPFGVFGERLHPSWINRFVTAPPIYGHHVAAFGADPLLPVIADVGAMARATFDLGSANLSLNGFIVQGPAAGMHEEEAHGDAEEEEEEFPELAFPGSSQDNNTNKMIGGRIDLALSPQAEFDFSAFTGTYDEESVLDFTGYNIAAEGHYRSFEVRGEYVRTRQQVETEEGLPVLTRHGFYAQGSYRRGAFEPVARWTQVFDNKLDGEVVGDGATQTAIGLDYWFAPSITVMAGYEINREGGPEISNDRLVVHVAFGF